MSMKYSVVVIVCLALTFVQLVHCQDEEITGEEREALRSLRPKIRNIIYKDFMHRDDFLLPFLRARKLDVDRATTMIENMVKWRRENNVDSVHNEDVSKVEKCIQVKLGGRDKSGRPIVYSQMGQWDIRKCVLAGQSAALHRLIIKNQLEGPARIARASRNPSTGGNVTQLTSIMDMQGFNLRSGACLGCLQFFGVWTYNYEFYYPASVYKYYFLNTPSSFKAVLDFVKPLHTPGTSKALAPLEFDKTANIKELQKTMALDQIPALFGGQWKEKRN